MDTSISKRAYIFSFWFICLIFLGPGAFGQQHVRDLFLGTDAQEYSGIRSQVVDTIESQLGVRELTGNNDGKDVEKYLKCVNLGSGYAWCAAFVSWVFIVNEVPNPSSAWSPHFGKAGEFLIYKKNGLKKNFDVKPGMVFTLYYTRLKRIGHTGFIMYEDENYYYTIEGNTNGLGSREGDGVYKKKRRKSSIFTITDYVGPLEN